MCEGHSAQEHEVTQGNTAVKEIRWRGQGIMNRGNFTMFYSGSTDNNVVGKEFLVHKQYKTEVTGWASV